MKKVISFMITIYLVLCLSGCTTVQGEKNYTENTNNRLIPVSEQTDLYYDANTKVVYIIFNESDEYAGYGYMSPYYASNGMPYMYNVEAGCLEEINMEDKT